MPKKPGRTRSSSAIPAHINADKLPDHVYFNRSGAGKWMQNFYDEFGKLVLDAHIAVTDSGIKHMPKMLGLGSDGA